MIHELTHREEEIFTRLAEGRSYKQIADELYICVGTVGVHAMRIYRKLNIHSKREARNVYNERKAKS